MKTKKYAYCTHCKTLCRVSTFHIVQKKCSNRQIAPRDQQRRAEEPTTRKTAVCREKMKCPVPELYREPVETEAFMKKEWKKA